MGQAQLPLPRVPLSAPRACANFLRSLIATAFRPVPVSWLHQVASPALILPYYHIVSDESVPHVSNLYVYRNVRQFKGDIDYFLSHFRPVSLADVIAHIDGRAPLPDRSIHLTFDDGFREMHEVVAPILHAKGVPATFFISSGFLDNADMAHHPKLSALLDHLLRTAPASAIAETQLILNRHAIPGNDFRRQFVSIPYTHRHLVDDLARLGEYDFAAYLANQRPYLTTTQVHALLQQGFTIGSHSIDHPLYADQPLAEQVRQTTESMDELERKFALSYRTFAFPHTDVGVTAEYFQCIFQEHRFALSFGTRGMVGHFAPRNLERFRMEGAFQPPRDIITRQYVRSIYKRFRRAA